MSQDGKRVTILQTLSLYTRWYLWRLDTVLAVETMTHSDTATIAHHLPIARSLLSYVSLFSFFKNITILVRRVLRGQLTDRAAIVYRLQVGRHQAFHEQTLIRMPVPPDSDASACGGYSGDRRIYHGIPSLKLIIASAVWNSTRFHLQGNIPLWMLRL